MTRSPARAAKIPLSRTVRSAHSGTTLPPSSTRSFGTKRDREFQELTEVLERSLRGAGVGVKELLANLPSVRRALYRERYGKR